jgi:RNA polymerase sigma-70 factor (ECF subfamily)
MPGSEKHLEGPDSGPGTHADTLEQWLADGYAPAYRTACLILRNPADAEEAVQEAFLRAWRFRAAVPAGEGVRPWLYRVVVNACLSKLRSDRSRRQGSEAYEDLAQLTADEEPGPEALALHSDVHTTVLAALGRLPGRLRIVVVLRYYAQLNEREIAAAIHRRPGTVKSRLHEARVALGADPHLSFYGPVGAAAGGTQGDVDA